MSKAYAQPLKKQAWRLFSNAATGYDIQSEIIPIYGSTSGRRSIHYLHIIMKVNEVIHGLALILYQSGDTVKGTVSLIMSLPDVVYKAQE